MGFSQIFNSSLARMNLVAMVIFEIFPGNTFKSFRVDSIGRRENASIISWSIHVYLEAIVRLIIQDTINCCHKWSLIELFV